MQPITLTQAEIKQFIHEVLDTPESIQSWQRLAALCRRQAIRQLPAETTLPRANVIRMLQNGLSDPDWEVRAAAMIIAVRSHVPEVADLINTLNLPHTRKEGLSHLDLRIVHDLHQAAKQCLGKRQIPEDTAEPPTDRETMAIHMLRCVAGLPTRWHDQIYLWSIALTQPLDVIRLPEALPAGVVREDTRFYLERTRLELAWIAPVAHWLGSDADNLTFGSQQALPNTIRQYRSNEGFFISRWPVTANFLRPLIPASVFAEYPEMPEYAAMTWLQAQQVCAALTDREGIPITLPTPEMWEMAARGPDARRYPWGNGLVRHFEEYPSPWGAMAMFGMLAQWTSGQTAEQQPVFCGSPQHRHCAWHTSASDRTVLAVRPAVVV